ncbi:pitrilysin family protein [soil metagenome]
MFKGSSNIKENEFIPIIMQSGGVCNAFTFQDATVYYERMPSNQIEQALWMESDRMVSLNFGKETFETEKKVVLEEKLQRYDNAPYGTVFYNIFKNIFSGSLYEHLVIGYEDDIKNFTLEGAANFHSNFYSPENAALIVTGDFEIMQMKDLINKYYSDIKRNNKSEKRINNINDYKGYKKITVEDNVALSKIYLTYQVTGLKKEDQYPLEFIEVLTAGNRSSRLYKKLVYEKKLLKSVNAYRYLLGDGGMFIIEGTLLERSDINEIEEMIAEEIENFKDINISDKEIEKVKNEIEQREYSSLISEQSIALKTMYNWLYYKDTSRINTETEKSLRVDKKNIIETAQKFLKKDNRFTMNYIPKA